MGAPYIYDISRLRVKGRKWKINFKFWKTDASHGYGIQLGITGLQ